MPWQSGNKSARRLLVLKGRKCPLWNESALTMLEPAEDVIVRNLIEALGRLREDLDRMELWATTLGSFAHPVPEYRPGDEPYRLKPPADAQRRHGH
jgi:hypothetical protein